MSLNDIIKKLFGNKSQRDLKEIQPLLIKSRKSIRRSKRWITTLWRACTLLKKEISDYVATEVKERDELRPLLKRCLWKIERRYLSRSTKLEKLLRNWRLLGRSSSGCFCCHEGNGERFTTNSEIVVLATDLTVTLQPRRISYVSREITLFIATIGQPEVMIRYGYGSL